MAKFGTSVQTGDMQGFQTLDSLKVEPRLDPKSTKDNGSLSQSPDIRPLCSERRIEFSQDWQIKPRQVLARGVEHLWDTMFIPGIIYMWGTRFLVYLYRKYSHSTLFKWEFFWYFSKLFYLYNGAIFHSPPALRMLPVMPLSVHIFHDSGTNEYHRRFKAPPVISLVYYNAVRYLAYCNYKIHFNLSKICFLLMTHKREKFRILFHCLASLPKLLHYKLWNAMSLNEPTICNNQISSYYLKSKYAQEKQ